MFGEVLKMENILRNYDEFIENGSLLSPGLMQDMRSVYVDIRRKLMVVVEVVLQKQVLIFQTLNLKLNYLKQMKFR